MAGTVVLPIPPQGYDGTNPARILYSQNVPKLLFDAATDELCLWHFRMPENYSSAPILKVQYSMATATANEVIIRCEVMAVSDGDSQDLDADSYDTVNTSSATTVPGTAGHLDEISLTLSNNDALAAGDYVRIRFGRDADNAGDDAAGDMEVWAVSLEYTTT